MSEELAARIDLTSTVRRSFSSGPSCRGNIGCHTGKPVPVVAWQGPVRVTKDALSAYP